MRFFIFYFIYFFYFNWPLPPRTSETKNDWKVSTSIFSEIKWDFTHFLSSHVLIFFQNSKLSSFFVVKMKKKNNFKKNKWKSEFCKIKCAQKNKCRRQLWDTDFFFLALSLIRVKKYKCDPSQQNRALVGVERSCAIPFIWKSIQSALKWFLLCVNWMQHCNFMGRKRSQFLFIFLIFHTQID